MLLAVGLIVFLQATGSKVYVDFTYIFPNPEIHGAGILRENPNLFRLADDMLAINIFWPLINLRPVLPLDGGQIALQVLVQQDPWHGMQRALWLSVFTGGAMAMFGLLVIHDPLLMMLFASLAVSSYLTLQQSGGGHRPW